MSANQNSSSPKSFTEMRFRATVTITTMNALSHWGISAEELVVSTEPADVDSDSGGVCNGGHAQFSQYSHPGYECGLFAVEFAGGRRRSPRKGGEGSLAEGSKDQVAEEADDGVDNGEHGACVLQAATGAQEQAGTTRNRWRSSGVDVRQAPCGSLPVRV